MRTRADYLNKMKIAVMVRQLYVGHILWCDRVVRVERAHRVRVVRGVQKMPDVGNGVIGFDHVRFQVRDLVMAFLKDNPDPKPLADAARRLIFLKGRDSHDYKFSSAVLEDYHHLAPPWRDRFLAASVFNLKGAGAPDNDLVKRTRAALSG